jgi:hypothetical protein
MGGGENWGKWKGDRWAARAPFGEVKAPLLGVSGC